MAYQASKPLSTDQLSQSQADIAGNFTAIGTMMDPDNKNLQLPVASANPAAPAGDVGFLFSKLVGTNPELFWMSKTTGTAVEFTSSGKTATGWCRLPCGIIVKWGTSGSVTYGSTGTAALAYGTNVPTITSMLFCHVSPFTFSSSATDGTGTVSYVGFDEVAHTVTGRATACFSSGTGSKSLVFTYIMLGI